MSVSNYFFEVAFGTAIAALRLRNPLRPLSRNGLRYKAHAKRDDERTAATIVYSPGEVAQRLGISTAMLRRHTNTYQQVFNDLVLDARNGYQYTDLIVSRLEQSLAAVHAGHVQSVKDGLERLSEGSGLSEAYESQPEPLHVLAGAMQALHGEIQALRGEVAALREDNGMLRQQLKALEPPKDGKAAKSPTGTARRRTRHRNT